MNYYNYFTEIEEHFVRRRGSHLFVSPLDWSLIAAWKEAGVPLHIAIRGIDVAMDAWHAKKRRPTEKLSTLFYCHDAVMAEHERYLESRVGEAGGVEGAPSSDAGAAVAAGPDRGTLLDFMGARISEIKLLREKQFPRHETHELIERIIVRLSDIRQGIESAAKPEIDSLERDLGVLDELLIPALSETVPDERRKEWEAEARAELKVYRKRLPKETYGKILDNYLKSRVRRHFDVGELSLFHL